MFSEWCRPLLTRALDEAQRIWSCHYPAICFMEIKLILNIFLNAKRILQFNSAVSELQILSTLLSIAPRNLWHYISLTTRFWVSCKEEFMSYVLSFPRTKEEFTSSLIHRTVGKTMKETKSPLLFRLHLAFRLTTAVTIATLLLLALRHLLSPLRFVNNFLRRREKPDPRTKHWSSMVVIRCRTLYLLRSHMT